MSLFAKIIALLLLALWVPATLHCDLEAADLLQAAAHTDSCCQADQEPCADETCREFTLSSSNLTLTPSLYAAPLWVNDLHVLSVGLTFTAYQSVGAQFSHGATPAIQSLTRTWSFVRRSALPARAPDSVV